MENGQSNSFFLVGMFFLANRTSVPLELVGFLGSNFLAEKGPDLKLALKGVSSWLFRASMPWLVISRVVVLCV